MQYHSSFQNQLLKQGHAFEKVLNESYISLGKSISTRQPFGIGPIIGYVTSRSQEIQNIITIIKLKTENYPASEIKKFII